jgi:phosphate-selective porin OprO/OprP
MRRAMLAAAGVLLLALPARAQAPPRPVNTQEKKPQEKESDWGFRWENHPSLRLGEGTRIDFRARVQADLRWSEAPIPDDDDDLEGSGIDIARRRIGIEGEIINLFDYQVEREIGDDEDPWRDVYINYKQFDVAQAQAGKFKLPFSLDENTSPTNLDFIFRSRIAAQLAPGRAKGVMAHGRVLDRGILRYEIGVFDHDGRNARTNNPERVYGDRTIAGRVVVQPYRSRKSPLRDLAFGGAFTTSEVPEGFPGVRGRTTIEAVFFRPDLWVLGTRRRIGLEARWRPGPFSVKSEYIRLTDERQGQSVEDTDLSKFFGEGWYISGTWAITGEQKADGLDTPLKPILQGGFGAVEVAVRFERLSFGSTSDEGLPSTSPRADNILGNSDRVETYGVSWYLNRWVKIQANLVRETLDDPSQGPLPSQPSFWSRFIRFQFSL